MSLFRLCSFARIESSSEAFNAAIATPAQTSPSATDDLSEFLRCTDQNYYQSKLVAKKP